MAYIDLVQQLRGILTKREEVDMCQKERSSWRSNVIHPIEVEK
jgi:hypothetical protein